MSGDSSPNGGGRRVAREFRTVGVVGLGTMGAGIVEVFARNGLAGDRRRDRRGGRSRRGRSHLETSTGRAVDRGKLDPGGRRGAARADHHHHVAGRPGRRRPGRRGGAGEPRAQGRRCSPSWTRCAGPTSSSRPTRRRCRSPSWRCARAAPARSSGCTSSTRRRCRSSSRSSARSSPSRTSSTTSRRSPPAWTRCRSSSATAPGSSRTRCCSATSTTPRGCTSSATPAARTSTPPCATAAATRWARWRCWT